MYFSSVNHISISLEGKNKFAGSQAHTSFSLKDLTVSDRRVKNLQRQFEQRRQLGTEESTASCAPLQPGHWKAGDPVSLLFPSPWTDPR